MTFDDIIPLAKKAIDDGNYLNKFADVIGPCLVGVPRANFQVYDAMKSGCGKRAVEVGMMADIQSKVSPAIYSRIAIIDGEAESEAQLTLMCFDRLDSVLQDTKKFMEKINET